ncbi:hypothetical protein [Silicimonas sp. MF1-12-2]|uniref:hypothetical protein n=1 Tax=Silicimonas sp. MF1-12-2 TaxID=3384793 RepID=UPI0039B58EDD
MHPPEGTPTRIPDLPVNTGHGTPGWKMAGGAARAVGDLMMSRAPEIHKDWLTAARYG